MPTLSIPLHTRDIPYPFLTRTERGQRAELAVIMTSMNPLAFRTHGRRSPPFFLTLVERRLHEAGMLDPFKPKVPETPKDGDEPTPIMRRAAHEMLHRPFGLYCNPTPTPERSARARKKQGARHD